MVRKQSYGPSPRKPTNLRSSARHLVLVRRPGGGIIQPLGAVERVGSEVGDDGTFGAGGEGVRGAGLAEHATTPMHHLIPVVHLAVEHELDVVDVVGVARKHRAGGNPED